MTIKKKLIINIKNLKSDVKCIYMNFKKQILRLKPIEILIEESERNTGLKRSLDKKQLILLGIGATIGAGIFVITGKAASLYSGPAISISFIVSGIACICAGLCYAEFASLLPISGSSYVYTYAVFGEIFAWLLGSIVLFANIISISVVSRGWAAYIISLININVNNNELTIELLLTCLIIFLVTLILYFGVSISTKINLVAVIIKVFALIIFITFCFKKINLFNLKPFFYSNYNDLEIGGFSGIIGGASMVFMAYTGFDTIATAAQEAKNPKKDIPFAMTFSIIISMVLYILVSTTLVGITHYSNLNVMNPIAIALNNVNMPWLILFIKISSIAALTSVILVIMYSLTRITFSLAKDGFLPFFLTKTHKKFSTPHIITVIYFFIITLISWLIPLDKLTSLANFGHLTNFLIVCIGILYLFYKNKNLNKSYFICPFKPWIPICGIIFILNMWIGLFKSIYLYICIFIPFSLLFYILYSKKNIESIQENKKWIYKC